MNEVADAGSNVTGAFQNLYNAVIGFLPQLLVAVVLLLVGWIAARLLRALAVRLARGLDRFAATLGIERLAGNLRIRETTAGVVGSIVYWLVILVFVTVAAQQLGLGMVSVWLDRIVDYLPTLISGAIIVFAGVVIANIVRDAVVALARAVPEPQRTALGRTAQILVLATMVIVGIDQIGIDVTLINTLVAVVVGTFLAGLSIAFSLGARAFVSNLLGMRYLGGDISVGQRIRVDGIDGTVVEVGQTAIVLDTADGRARIPGSFLSEKPVVTVDGGRDDG